MIFKEMLSIKRTGESTKQKTSTIDITHPVIVPKNNIIAIHIFKILLDNNFFKKTWIILNFENKNIIKNNNNVIASNRTRLGKKLGKT